MPETSMFHANASDGDRVLATRIEGEFTREAPEQSEGIVYFPMSLSGVILARNTPLRLDISGGRSFMVDLVRREMHGGRVVAAFRTNGPDLR
jgi:hypothetical protein